MDPSSEVQASPTASPVLEVEGVGLSYPGTGGASVTVVLAGLSLSVAAGEAVAIVGPSGSGKSTLMHLLGALATPTSGSVRLDGVDLASLGEAQLAELRNRRVGFVFQTHHLLPQCTALENVLVPTLVGGDAASRASARERALALLAQVGLAERAGHRPAQLSGGECQRVAVARALINRPALLLADEPTGSLDGESADALGDLFVRLVREEGVTLVAVTHSPRLAARMDRVLELKAGALHSTAATP